MSYEELLKKARKELPKTIVSSKERFEIPKVSGHVEGNKTIITNFMQICDIFGREFSQLLKYLQKELATPAVLENQRLIFDTKLIREDRFLFLKCTACGAKHSVTAKI